MNGKILFMFVLLSGISTATALADEESRAIRECKETIREHYSIDGFRNVFADRIGHHRYRIYGKVKRHGHRYPFNCTVKRGWVQSYYYDGPHGGWDGEWTDGREYQREKKHKKNKKKHERDIAIGVGLAAVAVAAMAAAANQPSGGKKGASGTKFRYDEHVDESYLEDECGEELGGRIRREHQGVSRIELDEARAEHQGSMLRGKGIIHWQHRQPSDFRYTCYFDKSGQVMDSSYEYY